MENLCFSFLNPPRNPSRWAEKDVANRVMQSTVYLPEFSHQAFAFLGLAAQTSYFRVIGFVLGKSHGFSFNPGGEGVSQAHLRDVWWFGDFLLVWPGQADPFAAA